MQRCRGAASGRHAPARACARRCEPRQVRRRRALLRSQPCRRHPTVRSASLRVPAARRGRRRCSRRDAATPSPRVPAILACLRDPAVVVAASRAIPFSTHVPAARGRDVRRRAIAAADPPRPQACAGRGGWPPAGFFYLRPSAPGVSSGVSASARRQRRSRRIPPRLGARRSLPSRRRPTFARALRKLRPQPDTAHAQAPDTAQARGDRSEVAFSIQTQATRFVSLRAATHPARRCEGAQRPRRPLARRAGSGRARGRGARLRLRAAPAPTT